MKYLIGLDVGTSNVKAVLFDLDGNEISSRTSPPTSSPSTATGRNRT